MTSAIADDGADPEDVASWLLSSSVSNNYSVCVRELKKVIDVEGLTVS